MRASLNWLKEFVDFSLTPQELSRILTMAGLEVEDVEELEDDTIFEIAVTPNRPDCLSIKGIAREISANLGLSLKKEPTTIKKEQGDGPKIEIKDSRLCPRYASRIIYGVKPGSSPEWISRRLESHGFRPKNNIVDITNYVLLEMGHPLHAFDLDKLAGGRILVKTAGSTQNFQTLDGEERTLNKDMLLIWDAERPVAIAGVMGGLNSEVTLSTANVLLESAYFSPISVRRTSKALNLNTDASYRFERGTDINGLIAALDRAAALITEIAGGAVTNISDNYPEPYSPRQVSVEFKKINSLLGTYVDEAEVQRLLNRLGLENRREGEGVVVTPPSFRHDIQRDVDIIEEIARLYGYDKIPSSLPSVRLHPVSDKTERKTINTIKDAMIKSGFTEVINLSFLNPVSLDKLNIPADDRRRALIYLRNPLRKEEAALRTTLIPALLDNVGLNQNRGEKAVSFFEISRVFLASGQKLPDEVMQMAAVYCKAHAAATIWQKQHEGFFDIKGVLENLLKELRVKDYSFSQCKPSCEPYLHPAKSCVIKINGQIIGSIGTLHPSVAQTFDLTGDISLLEIYDVKKLLNAIPLKITFTSLPKYPYIERDIAVVVSKGITVEEIKNIILSSGSEIIEFVKLFDIYTGKQIPNDKKSLAFSIRYRRNDRTLTDSEVDALHSKIIEKLKNSLGAELRG